MGATILGWEFDADSSDEARAAWSVYADLPDNLPGLSVGDTIQDAFIAGFDAKRSTEPVVVLPTEPGVYADRMGHPWRVNSEGSFENGQWFARPWDEDESRALNEKAPFTLLRPVPKVAAEVITFISEAIEGPDRARSFSAAFAAAKVKFGVTS